MCAILPARLLQLQTSHLVHGNPVGARTVGVGGPKWLATSIVHHQVTITLKINRHSVLEPAELAETLIESVVPV